MAEMRFCVTCGQDVEPREERTEYAVSIYCPRCERRMATHYGHIMLL